MADTSGRTCERDGPAAHTSEIFTSSLPAPQALRDLWATYMTGGSNVGAGAPVVHLCHCIGPQSGQTKCPCAVAAEMRMYERMIRDGVLIAGRRYRLVAEDEA